jgi:hypothetical protein
MNLRQYRRTEIVQGGLIMGIWPTLESVTVAGADGEPVAVNSPRLFSGDVTPRIGDELLIYPDGSIVCISADEFDAQWETVHGPLLS